MSENRRIVFITGANTGLGLEIVKALYSSPHSYDIIVGSRLVSNGEAAVASVQQRTPSSSSSLSVLQLDLSSDESIHNAVENIKSKFGRLDVLVNNGGAGFDGALRDGQLSIREAWNLSWDVNVAGTQVLTSEAVPLLLNSIDPRLIFITSGASALAYTERFDAPALQRVNASPAPGWPKPKEINPIEAYRNAKTGLNMMMRQWHRILLSDGVKVWAISPGFLATNLGNVGVEQLKRMGARDPAEGGSFVRGVIEGGQDSEVGKVVGPHGVQPW